MPATQTMTVPGAPQLHLQSLTGHPNKTARASLLFVHGLGHAEWCWANWMRAAAEAGYDSYAVALRGHGSSGGSVRGARLSHYVNDVIRAAKAIPAQNLVLIGHSMGALIVQRAIEPIRPAAAVLVASLPAGPALRTAASLTVQAPWETVRFIFGRPIRLPRDVLFHGLDRATAAEHLKHITGDSALAQYQILLRRHTRRARTPIPMLTVASKADRLVPIASQRSTARHFNADMVEFNDLGHDMMLDRGWESAWAAIESWIGSRLTPDRICDLQRHEPSA